MLSSFQRNFFFQPNSDINSPPLPAIIKNDFSNNNSLITSTNSTSFNELFNCSESKLVNWLKIDVELEEELASKIGHLLVNNGFDCLEFLV